MGHRDGVLYRLVAVPVNEDDIPGRDATHEDDLVCRGCAVGHEIRTVSPENFCGILLGIADRT